jgi:hypothetical protein
MAMPYIGFTFPITVAGHQGVMFTPYAGWIIERGQQRFITDESSGGGTFNLFKDNVTRHGLGLGANVDVQFRSRNGITPFIGTNIQVSIMSGQSHRYTTPHFGLGYDTNLGSNVEVRAAVRAGFKIDPAVFTLQRPLTN